MMYYLHPACFGVTVISFELPEIVKVDSQCPATFTVPVFPESHVFISKFPFKSVVKSVVLLPIFTVTLVFAFPVLNVTVKYISKRVL